MIGLGPAFGEVGSVNVASSCSPPTPLQHPQTLLEQASMLEFVGMYADQRRFAALGAGFWVSQLL